MKIKFKNSIPIISIIVSSILILSIFSYIGFKSQTVQQATNEKVAKMQYVLVNEDKGTFFEGEKYSLGTDFVTLINQDTANRWETTTRNVASRGISDGQFDALIIIPQDFSERLLSLQSINPEKALVQYQVREGQNEVTNQNIQVKVNDVLKDFNQRIVQMYFSSIVGNLSEAQKNVNQIVGLETAHTNTLEKTIYVPFKEVPMNFSSVLDTASILDEENKLFTSEQQAFVQAVKELMASNNSSLDENRQSTEEVQKSVNEYADEGNEKLATSVEQFNQQFELQKEQLEEQWGKDLSNYKNQYDLFENSMANQLGLFYTKEIGTSESSGVYADFLKNAYAFKDTQSKRLKELTDEIASLESQVVELSQLKATIAEKYYNDQNANPDTATEEQVKLAISKLLSPTNKESEIKDNGAYLNAVNNELIQLQNLALPSNTDFPILLQLLINDGLLSQPTGDKLNASYNIVSSYKPDLIGNGNQFNILATSPKADSTSIFTVTNTVGINLSPNSNQSLQFNYSFLPGSSGTVELLNLEGIRGNLEQRILSELVDSDCTATVSIVGNQLDIAIVSNQTDPSVPAKLPKNTSMVYTFDSQMKWIYPNDYSSNEFFQCNYSWYLNGVSTSGQLATYIDKAQPLKQDLPELFTIFTLLTSAADKLTMLYADPTSLDSSSFANYVANNPGKSFNELATTDSVYWLYNNITDSKKIEEISDSLYLNYKSNGDSLYKDTDEQINKLQAIIGTNEDKNEGAAQTLYGTLNLMTVPEKMLQEAALLEAWFDTANKEIAATYGSWKEADKVAVQSIITETNRHPDKNDTTAINAEAEGLAKSIQALASSSKEIAKTTEASAAQVKDVAPIIKSLKVATDKVQANATDILTNLDKTVVEVRETTKDNSQYAKAFDKVLSNTKNGGSDNTTVFNFLSNPIQEKGDFGKTRQNSLIPYYATVIVAFMVILVSVALQKYMKRRELSAEDLLMNPSRAWYNINNVVIIVLNSLVISGIFAWNMSLVEGVYSQIAWVSYSFLVLFSGLLLILAFMRQFRLFTLYLCGGLLGLFFMLTPLLGVTIKTGSFINLIYRFSPLQNIQNGFTALLNGASIGWLSYTLLALIAVGGILLNFWAKPEDVKDNQ